MENNTIEIVESYLEKIKESLKKIEEKENVSKELSAEIEELLKTTNDQDVLGPIFVKSENLKKEIKQIKEQLEDPIIDYHAYLEVYNETVTRLNELREKMKPNINDGLYKLYGHNEFSTKLYMTKEEKMKYELSKLRSEKEIEFLENSMNDFIEPLKSIEQKIDDAIKGKDDNYRDLTLEEAKNQDELVNNAKSLEGISEKTDDSINNNENFSELNYDEARSIIEYGKRDNDGELSDEESIKHKPKLDKLMKKTGAKNMSELYEKAREVVNENKSNINDSAEKQIDFINTADVSEFNKEEKNRIKEALELDEGTSLDNKQLSKLQSRMVAEAPLKEEPEKKTLKERFTVSKIGQTLEKLDNAIAKNTGKAVMAAIAIGAVAVTGGLALSAAGLTVGGATMLGGAAVTYQEFNKGKKL